MATERALEPRNILIVRLSALGDVVISSGLIPALRSRYPGARLSWLVEPAAAPLLAHNPHLDELIILPRARWRGLWREGRRWQALSEARGFFRMLRAQKFDLTVDPQGLLKSGVLAWLTRAPRRVNLWPRESSQWLVHESVHHVPSDAPVIGHEYQALAEHLGAAPGSFRLDLAVGEAARSKARAVLADAGVRGPHAVLAAFTTRPQKHWFEDRWIELARGLQAQGLTPVLLGGPADVEAANRICAANPAICNLAGRLKLDETVAAVADSQLLVGVDTGLTHMGIALNVPTVALFGSTTPYLRGPIAGLSEILYEKLSCSPCDRRPTCQGRFDCMRQLDVERVLAATLRVRDSSIEPS